MDTKVEDQTGIGFFNVCRSWDLGYMYVQDGIGFLDTCMYKFELDFWM